MVDVLNEFLNMNDLDHYAGRKKAHKRAGLDCTVQNTILKEILLQCFDRFF